MNCHQCGFETEFVCDRCGEPVCERCCVQMTYHNQIDYPLCTTCNDGLEAERSERYHKDEEEKQREEEIKRARNAKARSNYHKPENIEKRKKQRAEKKRIKAEIARKQLSEALKIIGSMIG